MINTNKSAQAGEKTQNTNTETADTHRKTRHKQTANKPRRLVTAEAQSADKHKNPWSRRKTKDKQQELAEAAETDQNRRKAQAIARDKQQKTIGRTNECRKLKNTKKTSTTETTQNTAKQMQRTFLQTKPQKERRKETAQQIAENNWNPSKKQSRPPQN